ncbi:MAG: putative transposase [Actinomycetota bacterium]|nr:putative transposase [Actinomycetota bacterium]
MRTDQDDNPTSDPMSDPMGDSRLRVSSQAASVVSVRGQGERRDRGERVQALAVFRFQLISPAIDEDLSMRARGRLVREIASAWHTDPFGRRVKYSRDTLDRWIRRWREGGFEALVPCEKATPLRTDPAVLEIAAALKRENPARTAAQVERILVRAHGWSPSQSTLLRLFHRLELPGADGQVHDGAVFGRFEAAAPNDLWTGDALHGKRIGGRKTYLFAFVDDHSRVITGYRWGFAEDTVRLAAALRPGLVSRGVPRAVYVDNGSAFVDAWLARACAKLGVRLTHSTPGRPQGRGKIERLFGTVTEQFLVEVADTTAQDLTAAGVSQAQALLDLNRLFRAWVETVYHPRVHSETEQTPLARWADGFARAGTGPQIPSSADLKEAFAWSQYRTVNRRTATVSLLNNTYQVDASLVGRRVELVFDPFDLTTVHVRYQGKPFPDATPLVIGRHSHPRARPETATTAPAPSTGINYLELVAADHHKATAAGINFHALTTTGPTGGGAHNGDGHAGGPPPGGVPAQMALPDMPAVPGDLADLAVTDPATVDAAVTGPDGASAPRNGVASS